MPYVHLTRYHGVFAPHCKYRSTILKRENINKTPKVNIQTEGKKQTKMRWAQSLKRAFNIDIEKCESCGGVVKVIAFIEDPVVINKILTHLNLQPIAINQISLPINRAPPVIH
jgi:rRNA maturation protein Nop10